MALEQPFQLLHANSAPLSSCSLATTDRLKPMPPPTTPSPSSHIPPPASPTSFTPVSESTSLPSLPAQNPLFQLPSSASLDSQLPSNNLDLDISALPTSASIQLDVDPQILEALKNKDRIYVLRMGELMEGLIRDGRPRIDLVPSTSYQRMLVHRCSTFYGLRPENDPTNKSIIWVFPTPESRIPARRLCDLVPAEAITQPAFKIMRRSLPDRDRRSNKTQSQAGSVTGEDADLSDVEPSESGSLGGRSNATGGSSNKKRMTIEEREAAYNEARSRIFMDFEEKEKEKEKDMSASSSSLSLVSGSGGGGGSSVTDELDETVSSPATESEYSGPSGPNLREKKDSRHSTRNTSASASSSSKSLRSAPSYSGGGPSSSRNSRAPSPSFTYATIYEPNQGTIYDPSQPPPPHAYHPTQYAYPYSPPGQPPNAYFGGYPYYPTYNPYQSPPPTHTVSDPSTPSSSEPYMSPQHSAYANHPYGWPHPPQIQSPPTHMPVSSQMPPPPPPPPPMQSMNHPIPPPLHSPPYPPYMPPPHHPYAYPSAPYYPPQPGQHMESPPHPQQNMYEIPRSLNGAVMGNPAHNNSAPSVVRGGVSNQANHPSNNGRSSGRHNGTNGVKGRSAPAINDGRGAWSYGPGVSQGGHVASFGTGGGEAMGPRLNNSRKTSNNSATSSVHSRSSNCDDVSSTASSSTTSSSSRRTYTSATSSQHPLPPRPDWAVGLKPQPKIHGSYGQSRHHDHSHNNSRTMSPISMPRNLNGNSTTHSNNNSANHGLSPTQPSPLQSTADFPPLSSVSGSAPTERRMPVASGAWGNNTSNRTIRMPIPGQHNVGIPVQHFNPAGNADAHLEYTDHDYSRPPPKSAELYNPKVLRRPATQGKGQSEKERERTVMVADSVLADQVQSMTLVADAEISSPAPSQPSASPKENS